MTNIRRRKQFRFTSPEGSAFMTELQYTFFLQQGSHTTDRFRFYEITTDEAGMTEDLVQRLIQLHYDPDDFRVQIAHHVAKAAVSMLNPAPHK